MKLVVLFSFFHLDTTIACQELARLKQALSTAYAAIKNNQQKVMKAINSLYENR